MSHKLTASLIVLMFYMNFMGPFVLRSVQPKEDHRNLAFEKVSDKTLKVLLVVFFFSFGIAIFAMVILCAFGFWPAILLIPVIIGIYYAHKDVVRQIKNRRLRWMSRNLSQNNLAKGKDSTDNTDSFLKDNDGYSALGSEDKTQLDATRKAVIIQKTEKYTNLLKEKYQIDKKMAAATKVTVGTYARRFAKSLGFMKPEAPKPGLNGEQMKKEMRGVYLYDLELQMALAKELAANPLSNTEAFYSQTEKRKRETRRQRLSYAINIVKLNFFKDKKFESSPEYKRTIFPLELSQLDKEAAELNKRIAALSKKPEEKKKLEEERDKVAAKITEIMKKDDPSKTKQQKDEEDSNRIIKHYRWGGIREWEMGTRFFEAYTRAAIWSLLQFEKINILTEMNERKLTAEQKSEAEKAIAEIDKKSDELLRGSDLK